MNRISAGGENETGGREAAREIPVFGILKHAGKVRVEVMRNVTGKTFLTMAIKKVKTGQFYLHR